MEGRKQAKPWLKADIAQQLSIFILVVIIHHHHQQQQETNKQRVFGWLLLCLLGKSLSLFQLPLVLSTPGEIL
jgi:hypothetical protein